MKFKLTVNMDNSAFDSHEPVELVRILRELASRIEAAGNMAHRVIDINGNIVGESTVEGKMDTQKIIKAVRDLGHSATAYYLKELGYTQVEIEKAVVEGALRWRSDGTLEVVD